MGLQWCIGCQPASQNHNHANRATKPLPRAAAHLVHEGGGVDGDLLAHRPVGVGDRLVHRHILQLLNRPVAECTPRGCEDDPGGWGCFGWKGGGVSGEVLVGEG